MRQSLRSIFKSDATWTLLGVGAIGFWGALAAALYYKTPVFALGGFALIAVLITLLDYRSLFYLMAASLPVSVSMEISGGFSLELPSEPLMIALLGIFTLRLISGKLYARDAQWKPLHRWLILILGWMLLVSVLSAFPARSIKFLIAKIWFLVPFIYLGEKIVRTPKDVKLLFWCVWTSMTAIVFLITILHAKEGFSFESAHLISVPFYFNGVSYAATLVAFIPWMVIATRWYPIRHPAGILIRLSILLLLIAAIFTYKRGAWVALVLLPFFDFGLRSRLLRPGVILALACVLIGVVYILQNNRYYLFAPTFKETLWHGDDLSGHLEATVSGTEISGVERFYRWVAAKNMVAARPWTGFGPSTFNQVYKQYADDAFSTYVSDNPEQSTTHNYFLMTFSEQGIPGGVLWIGFLAWIFIDAERKYHLTHSSFRREMIRMGAMTIFAVVFFCLLNELIELDEVGGLFWLSLLLIHNSSIIADEIPRENQA